MQHADTAVITTALREFGRNLLAADPPPPVFTELSQEDSKDYAQDMTDEAIIDLEMVIDCDAYDNRNGDRLESGASAVRAAERTFWRVSKIDPSALSAGARLMVQQGVARVLVERHNQYNHRLTDRVLPYQPRDPLLAHPAGAPAVNAIHRGAPTATADYSPAFREAVDAYIAVKSGVVWVKRTEDETRRILQLAADFFGADRPIADITVADVRAFRDQLVTWRRKPSQGAKLQEIANAPVSQRIGRKTAAKYFWCLTAAFRHWVDEGFLSSSPVGSIKVLVGAKPKGKARDSFSDEDLRALFGGPMYKGCKGPLRRTVPGSVVIKDGYYWVPLVATLTGMRVSEIVQMQCADVDLSADIPIIRVRGDEAAGKTVKTAAGWRDVPVHSLLLRLEFAEFVNERALDGMYTRLFADVTASATGGAGGEFSKWFGRRLTSLGIKRPTLTFHSFRHRFTQELREAGAPQYIIDTIVGHEGRTTADGYGDKASTAACAPWVNKLAHLDPLFPSQTD